MNREVHVRFCERFRGEIPLYLLDLLTSCTTSAEKEGEIIKDSRGNYYRLTNDKVFGNERYRLIEIDTTSFKRF